jgi:hypothetical protein
MSGIIGTESAILPPTAWYQLAGGEPVQPGLQTGILREKVESITGTPGTCASPTRRVFASRNRGSLIKALQPDQTIAGGLQKRRVPPGRDAPPRVWCVPSAYARDPTGVTGPTATIPRSQVL